MKIIEEPFRGVFLLEPRVFEDRRGFFYEYYNKEKFRAATGLDVDFVQDNLAGSTYGVFRGMHFQREPYAQAKLVGCVEGEILDIIVDIRPESPDFGRWYGVRLSAANRRQLFIPKGFAHGYLALSPQVKVFYKTDCFYRPDYDAGFRWNDPSVGIELPLPSGELILSDKDLHLPPLRQALKG